MIDSTRPSRPYHHGDLRRALIDAATDLASAGGADGVVLREAARRVGVSPSAAYRHFPSRQSLLATVGSAARERLARRMLAGDTTDPKARFQATGRAYIEFALEEPGLFEVAFRPCPPGLFVPEDTLAVPRAVGGPRRPRSRWRARRATGRRRGTGLGCGPRCCRAARRGDDPASRAPARDRGDARHGRRRVVATEDGLTETPVSRAEAGPGASAPARSIPSPRRPVSRRDRRAPRGRRRGPRGTSARSRAGHRRGRRPDRGRRRR